MDTFDEGLPSDWTEFNDEASGSNYYYNAKSKRNTWTRPQMAAAHMAAAPGGATTTMVCA